MKIVAPLLKYIAGILIFFITAPGMAQQRPAPVDISRIILTDTFNTQCWFYADSLRSVKPEQLTTLPFRKKAPKNIFTTVSEKQVDKDWYLNFCLQNTGDTAISFYFYPGIYYSRIDLYVYNDSTKKADPLPVVLPDILPDSIGYRTITLPAHTRKMYYASLRFVKTDINNMDIRIVRDYYLLVLQEILNCLPAIIKCTIILLLAFY